MRLALIQIFLSIVKMTQHVNNHLNFIQQYKKYSNAENDEIIKDLGKALKKNILTVEQQRDLDRLGAAIIMGKVSDKDYGEDFRLIGKAILLKKLYGETRFLLRKVLLSDEKTAKVYLERLIYVLKNSRIERNIFQNDMPFQNDGVFIEEESASNGDFKKALSKDEEDYELIDTILKSNESLKNNHNRDFIILLQKSFKTDKQNDDKLNKTLVLLEIALALDKHKGVQYKKILELFVDSMKKGKPIEIDDQVILKYINHVLNPKAPSDNATIEKLAEKHLKDKNPILKRSGLLSSKRVVNQERSQALRTNSVPKNSSVNDRNRNQVLHPVNNSALGISGSTTLTRNAEHVTKKDKKRVKSKKRSKRSLKSKVKSNSESHKSKGKSKNSRKKSSKKTKKSRRSTENGDKHKSKNKDNKKTRKLKH